MKKKNDEKWINALRINLLSISIIIYDIAEIKGKSQRKKEGKKAKKVFMLILLKSLFWAYFTGRRQIKEEKERKKVRTRKLRGYERN